MSKQVPLLPILALLFISCAGIPHPVVESRSLIEPMGLCHAGGRGTEEKALLDSLGIDWVRLDLSWKRIQSHPGEYDFSAYDRMFDNTDAAGVKVLGILSYDTPWIHENPEGKRQIDPEDFSVWLEFVEAVSLRYRDRLGALEIWNEPNSNRFWTGSDEDFFRLTRETINLLKTVVPEIPVVAGSIIYNPFLGSGNYLKKFLESGVADDADAISRTQ